MATVSRGEPACERSRSSVQAYPRTIIRRTTSPRSNRPRSSRLWIRCSRPGCSRKGNHERRIVALTNSPQKVAEAQLANAGIRDRFDAVISADSVRHLKPAPQPYLAVASAHQAAPAELRLVAAHSWDIAGALAAGCLAAFVSRPGMVLSPIGAQPDIAGPDIAAVVDQIVAADLP
jgi:hypothetical protein